MRKFSRRYGFLLVIFIISLGLLIVKPEIGRKAFQISGSNLSEMLKLIPPIFILIGLFDTWVRQETMVGFMGENSGLLGVIIAFLLGSVAAGPLYVAFPVAGILLRKGCKFSNILIFVGAWSATKIPIALFEGSVMGWRFMTTRYALDIPVIIIIAYLTDIMIPAPERSLIYQNAKQLV